jgi:nucleoside-diphosphate-sugar epimerase
MRKVLVTGAGGFIGRHALGRLSERGFDVHAVTSSGSPSVRTACTWHRANLLDFAQIENLMRTVQPTHMLHFAWYAVPGKYWTSEENFLWVQASLELLRQFSKRGGQRVVMAGTCAEYDWDYGYCSEEVTPRKPTTPYGICKQALQEMLAAYSAVTGLSSAWGRIFFLYGDYEHPNRLVSSVIRSLLNTEPAPCSHGNQIRDFLHVQDVADAFVALLASDITGAVNIGSGQPVALKEVIYKIGDKIGLSELIQLGAISTTAKEPPLVVANVERLYNEVKWLPRYNLDAGIEQSINWWRNQLGSEKK